MAVALSAQATDKGVNKATRPLFARVHSAAEMLALGPDGLTEAIRTIGLYRTKAKNVMALSQLVVDRHGGEVPLEREALQALPGVGRKTASVVLNELERGARHRGGHPCLPRLAPAEAVRRQDA